MDASDYSTGYVPKSTVLAFVTNLELPSGRKLE
jgi:hypothetical protein